MFRISVRLPNLICEFFFFVIVCLFVFVGKVWIYIGEKCAILETKQ